MDEPKRWGLRLQSLSKALGALQKSLILAEPDYLQQAGILQLFAITAEIAWKVMKDFLEEEHLVDVASPVGAIRSATSAGALTPDQGREWLNAIKARNRIAHVYDEAEAQRILLDIRTKFAPLITETNEFFTSRNRTSGS